MALFKDNKGREWTLEVNTYTESLVHKECDLYLADAHWEFGDDQQVVPSDLLKRLGSNSGADLSMLARIIEALCRQQMADKGVELEDFLRSLGGKALNSAREALISEIGHFFPNQAQGRLTDKAIAVANAVDQIAQTRMMEAIDKINPGQLAQSVIASASSAQESAESTPGDTHLDS